MAITVLNVPDISCEHCERTITLSGVRTENVDIPGKQVHIDYGDLSRAHLVVADPFVHLTA